MQPAGSPESTPLCLSGLSLSNPFDGMDDFYVFDFANFSLAFHQEQIEINEENTGCQPR